MYQEKVRKPKTCHFIPLYDKSILAKIPTPPNPNNITLWFTCDDDNKWGLTIKSFDDDKDLFSKQYTWKCTWVNDANTKSLLPTKSSESFCQPIDPEIYLSLLSVVTTGQHKLKNKIKK